MGGWMGGRRDGWCVFYYCRTYYKAVRVGGGGEWRTCAMRDWWLGGQCDGWCLMYGWIGGWYGWICGQKDGYKGGV
jgi:hypothetical protein